MLLSESSTSDAARASGVTQAGDTESAGDTTQDAMVGLLQRLADAAGPSGHEDEPAALVADALRPYTDSVTRDALGNVIARVTGDASSEGGGRRPRVMLAAHIDEIGLMVTKIDEGGFLRFAPIGGVDPRALVAQQVVVLAADGPLPGFIGLKPPHLVTAAERNKAIPMDEMFIDIGFSADEVREKVRPGDVVTVKRPFRPLLGTRVTGKALDNRTSVAAMVESLRLLSDLRHEADVYAVATVQEEVGLRGAMVSAYGIVPDMAIAIDVGFGDQPGVPADKAIAMGKGPAIALGANVHPRLHEKLVDAARAHNIPHQIEPVPAASGTDGWALQVTRDGIPTAVISIPLRYMHTSVEVADTDDLRQTARLLAHFIAALKGDDAEGWSYDLT